ncbi:MAG: isoaspartyl peptidase/L-asparaginase [Bacteroidales bacterium]
MTVIFRIFILGLLIIGFGQAGVSQTDYALVIHGGAGNIARESISPEQEREYHEKLQEALLAGEELLKNGGTSLDAVEAAIRILEDSPLFNAGRGAVFTSEGNNELDASIMCGATLNAGAVAGITTLRHPVSAARKVMEVSPHVMLIGKGAEQFGYEQGLEVVDPSWFFDQRRWEQYREFLRRQQMRGAIDSNDKMGTVGAVALDTHGNLAAATSTGGMTGKQYGRVGDVPVIGAGTYANNATCAVSATGHGEFFIRYVVSHEISSLMRYRGASLDEAAGELINQTLKDAGGNGGVIAIDHQGNISMPFNTTAMFRGYIKSDGSRLVKIFAE